MVLKCPPDDAFDMYIPVLIWQVTLPDVVNGILIIVFAIVSLC